MECAISRRGPEGATFAGCAVASVARRLCRHAGVRAARAGGAACAAHGRRGSDSARSAERPRSPLTSSPVKERRSRAACRSPAADLAQRRSARAARRLGARGAGRGRLRAAAAARGADAAAPRLSEHPRLAAAALAGRGAGPARASSPEMPRPASASCRWTQGLDTGPVLLAAARSQSPATTPGGRSCRRSRGSAPQRCSRRSTGLGAGTLSGARRSLRGRHLRRQDRQSRSAHRLEPGRRPRSSARCGPSTPGRSPRRASTGEQLRILAARAVDSPAGARSKTAEPGHDHRRYPDDSLLVQCGNGLLAVDAGPAAWTPAGRGAGLRPRPVARGRAPWLGRPGPASGARALAGAARAVEAVVSRGESADAALAAGERGSERAAVRAIALGTLRWYLRLAPAVDALLERPRRVAAPVRALLVARAHQVEYSRNAPELMVHTAVDAARLLSQAQPRGSSTPCCAASSGARRALRGASTRPLPGALRIRAGWSTRIGGCLAGACRGDPRREQRSIRPWRCGSTSRAPAPRTISRALARTAVLNHNRYNGCPPPSFWSARWPSRSCPGFAEGLVSVQDAGAQLAAPLLDAAAGHAGAGCLRGSGRQDRASARAPRRGAPM